MTGESTPPPFVLFDGNKSARPVLMSVPHGGRFYPPVLVAKARVPAEALQRLEDRYADRLVAPVVMQDFPVIIATHARAWIDLNRDPREIDSSMLNDYCAPQKIARPTDKVRGGLGLFPHRLQPYGDLWQGGFDWIDFDARIRTIHSAYHVQLESMLDQAMMHHSNILLIDIHSMPSLSGTDPAVIVVGDAHGRSAPHWLVDHIMREVRLSGYKVAHNAPYAGGYIINRHSARDRGRYAVQLEIDRRLYLDADGDPEPDGCRILGDLIARIANGAELIMRQRLQNCDWAQAAE